MTALNLIITNPLGFLALGAVPVVVAIHFFQRRAKRATIPTLFLLQATQREVSSGRRFERLQNNIPLWLQILAVLAMTWFLIQPRYIHSQSTQRIAIVLDSSASMEVFREKVKPAIQRHFESWRNHAKHTELWLFESDTGSPRVYHGSSLVELLEELDRWHAHQGATDPTHTLRIARSLCGQEGVLVYISDTPPEGDVDLAYNAEALSIGQPTENCGFTGYDFVSEEGSPALIWQCTLRNYGRQTVQKTWFLETDDKQRSEPQLVTLDAGQTMTLQGAFPEGSDRCSLHLEKDAFIADDVLHLVRPLEKPVFMDVNQPASEDSGAASSYWNQLIESISYCKTPLASADIDVRIQKVSSKEEIQESIKQGSHTVSYLAHSGDRPSYRAGDITASQHELVDELQWDTLLIRDVEPIEIRPQDEVLLWQGDVPLLVLRYATVVLPSEKSDREGETEGASRKTTQHLICNFDPALSNAWRQEAFIVMLYRFIESVRIGKFFYERKLFETNQEISLAFPQLQLTSESLSGSLQQNRSLIYTTNSLQGETLAKEVISHGQILRAPIEPGFFEISDGDQLLLSGASYFADTREANFASCASKYIGSTQKYQAIDRHSREDHLWHFAVLLVLACLLFSWHFSNTSSQKQTI